MRFDQKLDETSVKTIAASEAYLLQRAQNLLTWKFDGINLPPSVAGTQTGHGYLVFQVKPKPGYAIGDIIPNSANIFFDFNPAIVTNTFETEFVETLKVDDFGDSSLVFYRIRCAMYCTFPQIKKLKQKLRLQIYWGKPFTNQL